LGQNKIFTGYYINMQGDTINGSFPGYSEWNKNPSKVEFINNGSTEEIVLTPKITSRFLVEGYDEYISYEGERLLNPIIDHQLLNEKYTIEATDVKEQIVTFLRVLVQTPGGNLYMFHDSKRNNFFYQVPGHPITELRFKRAMKENRITDYPEYREQLNKEFGEIILQKNLSSTLKMLTYSEVKLSNFFKEMFPSATTIRKLQGEDGKWVVGAGIAAYSIDVDRGSVYYISSKRFKNSFSPILYVGYLAPIARKFGKFFLFPKANFSSYKNISEMTNSTTTYQTNYLFTMQLGAGINIVNRDDFKFYIETDLGMLIHLGNRYSKVSGPYPGESIEFRYRGINYSAEVSAGTRINKKILISCSYMFPVTIGNFVYYSAQLSGVYLKAGYILK
jgi:hypothetical protein